MTQLIKGQEISKCLFGVFNFFHKFNKNMSPSSKNEIICLFFGRIHGLTICFWNYLTFIINTDYLYTLAYSTAQNITKSYSLLEVFPSYTFFHLINKKIPPMYILFFSTNIFFSVDATLYRNSNRPKKQKYNVHLSL